MCEIGCVLFAHSRVRVAVLVLEVVVLTASSGGGGDVEDLVLFRDKDIAGLCSALGDDGGVALHEVRTRVDVVVAAQHQVNAGLGEQRGELVAQLDDVLVGVVRALRERSVVETDDDPVGVCALLSDRVVDKLPVLRDVFGGGRVAVQADEQHIVVGEEVVARVVFLVGQVERVVEVSLGGVGLVVATKRA